MQKNIYKMAIALITLSSLSACTKDYEKEPLEFVTESYLWNDQDPTGVYAENFLMGVYTTLLDRAEISGVPIDATTDDAVASNNSAVIRGLAANGYSPSAVYDDVYDQMYRGIRKSNIFLANYLKVPWEDANKKVWFPSEARFLRAYFYYELIKRYGGVILLGDEVLTLSDDIQLPKNTFDQCVAYIVSECDAIKNNLRPEIALSSPSRTSDPNSGRITQGAALSLKAKVLLLAASPLNNPSNDATKWKAAADAAKDVMTLGTFTLEPNFITIFTTRTNKETILYRSGIAANQDIEKWLSPIGYTNVAAEGRVSPTQELVDAFPDKNGVAINAPGTLYTETDPYTNRDPRFYNTIFHNNMKWLNRLIETFEGGKDKPNIGTAVQTQTGYYQRKFSSDLTNATSLSNHDHTWIFMRYADIILGFAEAQNEVDAAPSAAVYQVLIDIRKRAGITAGANTLYGLKANMTKDEMRDAIRLERRLELSFEGQRYFDLRRWKIAETVYNKPLTAMKIIKNTNGTFTYERVKNVPGPYFTTRMNRYPFNINEILKNSKLIQNDGY